MQFRTSFGDSQNIGWGTWLGTIFFWLPQLEECNMPWYVVVFAGQLRLDKVGHEQIIGSHDCFYNMFFIRLGDSPLKSHLYSASLFQIPTIFPTSMSQHIQWSIPKRIMLNPHLIPFVDVFFHVFPSIFPHSADIPCFRGSRCTPPCCGSQPWPRAIPSAVACRNSWTWRHLDLERVRPKRDLEMANKMSIDGGFLTIGKMNMNFLEWIVPCKNGDFPCVGLPEGTRGFEHHLNV